MSSTEKQLVVNFLALLTIFSDLVVLAAVALWLGSKVSRGLAGARESFVESVQPYAVRFALAVAAVAMSGSLWLSERAHFTPCNLCWYQRIAMYPLVPVLLVAAIRRDDRIRPYGLTLALLGLPISIYHYLVERFPSLETSACDPKNPCTLVWIWKFHFISIPFMAGSGFALIAVLLLTLSPRSSR